MDMNGCMQVAEGRKFARDQATSADTGTSWVPRPGSHEHHNGQYRLVMHTCHGYGKSTAAWTDHPWAQLFF